jgi:hypothetical protein
MKQLLNNRVPENLLDSLPIFIFFVEGHKIKKLINENLSYSKSDYYNTNKMCCVSFYKPVFLK